MIITCPWLTYKAVPRRCWAYVGYRRVEVYKVAVVAIRSHDLKVWKRGFDRETHLLIGKFIPTCPATPVVDQACPFKGPHPQGGDSGLQGADRPLPSHRM